MLEVIAIAVPVCVVGIGGYVHMWVKSNVNEANYTSIKSLIEEKFNAQSALFAQKLDNVDYRLERIERSMNGHLVKE